MESQKRKHLQNVDKDTSLWAVILGKTQLYFARHLHNLFYRLSFGFKQVVAKEYNNRTDLVLKLRLG